MKTLKILTAWRNVIESTSLVVFLTLGGDASAEEMTEEEGVDVRMENAGSRFFPPSRTIIEPEAHVKVGRRNQRAKQEKSRKEDLQHSKRHHEPVFPLG